ncbi:hypothetical protein BpHYR1_025404 [Brachionus plicatilis]|uniref:Uncharacterized protein n=1 Tax=Brachionus plicatilis TaxID=10195 RepID=A0A3M7Q8P5_BRAPC|nr:hypothetical protein BpHYR1_025404 [Brachionus plicatilis]
MVGVIGRHCLYLVRILVDCHDVLVLVSAVTFVVLAVSSMSTGMAMLFYFRNDEIRKDKNDKIDKKYEKKSQKSLHIETISVDTYGVNQMTNWKYISEDHACEKLRQLAYSLISSKKDFQKFAKYREKWSIKSQRPTKMANFRYFERSDKDCKNNS